MSIQSKVDNIDKMLLRNQEKILKLQFINSQLIQQKEKLTKQNLVKISPEEQSRIDKEKFKLQLQTSKRF